jgi:hypothetical protein
MNLKMNWLKVMALIVGSSFAFTSCDNDDADPGKGKVEFQITDSPSNDTNISGVFVTVTEVRVDGQAISGFSKQTVNLKALQNGNTKVLGMGELEAKSYNSVSLVLDLDADENGNAPGSYVQTTDNLKYKLVNSTSTSGTMEIGINKGWEVKNQATTQLIFDFNVDKSVKYSDNASVKYRFVSSANLQAAVRAVVKSESATIKGTYNESTASNAGRVVVYAYKKGTFNAATETTAQGEDATLFKNAVSSATIETGLSGNAYTLAYLDKGEYELHFARYDNESSTNRFVFKNMLQSELKLNGSVVSIVNIQSNADISLAATISGSVL